MKILIIRFSSLGDTILTTPCISLLKYIYPDAQIYFTIKAEFAEILPRGETTEIIPLNRGESLFSLAQRIRKEGVFHLVVDLHNSLRSKLLLLLLKKEKTLKYRKPYLKRWILVYIGLNLYDEVIPVVKRYMDVLMPVLGKELEGMNPTERTWKDFHIQVHSQTSGRIEKILRRTRGKKIISIAPTAKWFTKTWPLERFLKVTRYLLENTDYFIVFLGGKEPSEETCKMMIEKEFFVETEPKDPQDLRIFSLIGELSLAETSYIISRSEVLLCHDSGLMHIASAFKTKTVALFLSTVSEFGFFPTGDYPKEIISHPLDCKPCNHKGLARCPRKHFRCAQLIKPEEVSLKIVRLAEKTPII